MMPTTPETMDTAHHSGNQRRDATLSVSKQGDTLTINGIAYDFSVIPDGATLPASAVDCEYITGNVERINGVLHISLILPHGPNPNGVHRG